MKMINKCPFCDKSMPYTEAYVSKFSNIQYGVGMGMTAIVERRSCTSVYHNISILACYDDADSIGSIQLLIDPVKKIWAYWNFYENSFRVEFVSKKDIVKLPFFQPDFSLGYQKLANKIKTYITFS